MSSRTKLPRLFNFKKWLTLDDAARHLSLLFEEEVTVADVLQLALDKRLTLSVWFVNHTYAHKGRLAPLSECRMRVLPSLEAWGKKVPLPDKTVFTQQELAAIYPSIKEHVEAGDIIVTPDATSYSDNDQWLILDKAVVSIDGIWDLPMVASVALDVQHRYHMETGGPEITLINLEGALVCQDGVYCQLVANYEDNEFLKGSKANLELIKMRIKEDSLDKNVAESLLEAYRIKREKFLENQNHGDSSNRYFPVGVLPKDAVWGVRASAIRDFERSVRAAPGEAEKPLGRREETTLLNIMGALLGLLLGKSPAGKAHSVFNDQTAVIDALLAEHEGKPGIAKRTLEEKLAAAKRSLLSS